MHKSLLKKFNLEINKLLEGYNVYPRARAIQGRMPPIPAQNVNTTGALPTGFMGAGPTGIAPSTTATVLLKVPKSKKRKKKKTKL